MKISTERLKQIIKEELRLEMGNQNEIGIVAGGTFDMLQNLLKQIERSLNHLRKMT